VQEGIKKECKKFGSNQYNISIDIAEKLFSLLCDSYQVYSNFAVGRIATKSAISIMK
jgi:hypothetical protein